MTSDGLDASLVHVIKQMVLFVELDKGEEGGACRSLPAKFSLCPGPSMKASSEHDSQVMGSPMKFPKAAFLPWPVSPPITTATGSQEGAGLPSAA